MFSIDRQHLNSTDKLFPLDKQTTPLSDAFVGSLADTLRGSVKNLTFTPSESYKDASNTHASIDLPYYVEHVLREAQQLGQNAPTMEQIEKEFSYMRPQNVVLRGKEYRRYSLNDMGAGSYKRIQKQLYISENISRVAADAYLLPEKEGEYMETISGDEVAPLDHEMYMYSHLSKLLEQHPEMSRYFLRFYGKVRHADSSESCMSLELATGFEGHTSLRGMLVDIAKMARLSEVENDFVDEEINKLIEKAKVRVEYLKRQLRLFLTDAVIALRFLHEHRVVCSDVKPDNIFLHTDSSGSHAKIGDFGGAMLLDDPDFQLKKAQVTEGYHDRTMMQQIFRDRIDARHADLYALRKCIQEFQASKILSSDVYARIMKLPWGNLEDKEYASEILPSLQTLLILS